MTKFKAGDKVKIREDLTAGVDYGNVTALHAMAKGAGIISEVTYASEWGTCDLKDSHYSWSSEMLESHDNSDLVTVSKLFDKWYEGRVKRDYSKDRLLYEVARGWGRIMDGLSLEENRALTGEIEKDTEKHIRAILDGYNVAEDREPLYTVEGVDGHKMLCKLNDCVYEMSSIDTNMYIVDYHLTEDEIKGFDERYWAFKKRDRRIEL